MDQNKFKLTNNTLRKVVHEKIGSNFKDDSDPALFWLSPQQFLKHFSKKAVLGIMLMFKQKYFEDEFSGQSIHNISIHLKNGYLIESKVSTGNVRHLLNQVNSNK